MPGGSVKIKSSSELDEREYVKISIIQILFFNFEFNKTREIFSPYIYVSEKAYSERVKGQREIS